MRLASTIEGALFALAVAASLPGAAAASDDWTHWRGPNQNGTSAAVGLPEAPSPGGESELWTLELAGRGTPVISGDRLYALGYAGTGKDLREWLVCLDAWTGEKLWEHPFSDFLSDVIYDRYSIGSPTVDPETGNVYVLSTAGEVAAFTGDGRGLWRRSMQSEFGRLTFPNGRTGAPVVDGDRVVLHAITANWGPVNGPARDRFFAFDKQTGELIWVSTPGVGPKDSSFSPPVFRDVGGRRVLYAGTGCGNVVCIDARTGDALWRFPFATGGVNSGAVLHGDDTLVVIHGKENLDSSVIGRMAALRLDPPPAAGEPDLPRVLDSSVERWRLDLAAFTSSPVLVGDRVYETVATGELFAVDVPTGTIAWHEKLAPDQIHASPAYGDGKLYVPMNDGSFHVIRPGADGAEVLHRTQLEGNCLGAPAIADGRVFVHTTKRLYCFGRRPESSPAKGAAARLQVVPAEVLLVPGQSVPVRVRALDANGEIVRARVSDVEWTARGPASVVFDGDAVRAPDDGRLGISFVTATADGVSGPMRVRVVAGLPYGEDFESIPLDANGGDDVPFAFPPAHWIGARLKFDVRELDGSKVLAKTLDNNLFQRATAMFGTPDMKDYEARVDIRTDGNRRSMSTAGLVNQRYLVLLKGNHQELEISSNMERVKESAPFRWRPGVWYTLRTRVDVAADGSGVIRAKAWPRDEAEPEAWTLEVEHRHAHTHGAPGLYGFSPQSRFRVYMDNLQVTPHD